MIFFVLKPDHKEGEMIFNLFPVKDSVYHMATEKSHFYFISCMAVQFLIFMNELEKIRGC